MSGSDEAFKGRERLRLSRDFLAAYKEGKRMDFNGFTIYIRPNGLQYRRLGIVIPAKVNRGVTRTKNKRVLRELFRRNKSMFPPSHDIVFRLKKKGVLIDYHLTMELIRSALSQISDR